MQAVARGAAFSSTSSSSSSKRVFIGISNAIVRSNIQGRGKAYAASVPSGSVKPQKGQTRLSKQERRSMVESFVDKYRASNAGRFPTASHVRQEIGGSYYSIREIIQELEYNHKMSASNRMHTVQSGKPERIDHENSDAENEPALCDGEEILSSSTSTRVRSKMKVIDKAKVDKHPSGKDGKANMHLDVKEEKPDTDIVEKSFVEEPSRLVTNMKTPSSKHAVNKDGSQVRNAQRGTEAPPKDIYDASTSSISGGVQDINSFKPSNKEDVLTKPSVSLKLEATDDTSDSPSRDIETSQKNTEKLQDAHGSKEVQQIGNHEVAKAEDLHGDQPGWQRDEESSPKTTNLWENLKSLADGIINFWKKR